VFGAKAQPASFLGDFCNKIGTERTCRGKRAHVRFEGQSGHRLRIA